MLQRIDELVPGPVRLTGLSCRPVAWQEEQLLFPSLQGVGEFPQETTKEEWPTKDCLLSQLLHREVLRLQRLGV